MEKNDFFNRVFAVVEQIPVGKVTTYGAIAKSLGVASGARMVGYALNKSISSRSINEIPCHRVVNRNGQLTGESHFPAGLMRKQLVSEGVTFDENESVNMNEHFWNPENEIR